MNNCINLISRLRSPNNRVVLQAIEKLSTGGWLYDGTLKRVNLTHAHLQNADLQEADLEKSKLNMADLRWADLRNANLKGACLAKANLYRANLDGANLQNAVMIGTNLQGAYNLVVAQLNQVRCLQNATMPDGSHYDGRFSLPGDLQNAKGRRIDINDSAAMEKFYGAIVTPQSPNLNYTGLFGNTNEQLLQKLRSADHQLVIRALQELRARRCWHEGILKWAQLRFVHMQGADLSKACLEKADLSMADLRGADLSYSNLIGARLVRSDLRQADFYATLIDDAILSGTNLHGAINLSNEQLALASRLRGSTLPDGNFYDGRFNLMGDLSDAHFTGVDLDDPGAIADFYGVSLQDFLSGQKSTHKHLTTSMSVLRKEYLKLDTENLALWFAEQRY